MRTRRPNLTINHARLPSAAGWLVGVLSVVSLGSAATPGLAAPAGATAAAVSRGCEGAARRTGVAMGTRVSIVVCPVSADEAGRAKARVAAEAGFTEIGRLERLWSNWLPKSEVSRINAAAGKRSVVVSAETFELLAVAKRGSQRTGGLFDITFAPLGSVWRFDTPPGSHQPTRLERVPTRAEVKALLARVGWRHLKLNRATRSVKLDRVGAAIHLGGIGKGAAVDRVVALLRGRGFHGFAVQAGGDLYCAGNNGPRPWRVGIAHPRKKGSLLGWLHVQDAAFSTSGDYERFAIIDGRRYHHILDTRSGFPATASQSVSVLARSATDAEVLTKAAFVLGGAKGLELLHKQGAKGLVVAADGKFHQSPKLAVGRP